MGRSFSRTVKEESNSDSTGLQLNRFTVRKLRVGHRHRFYRLPHPSNLPIIIACVAHANVKPCRWGASYVSPPNQTDVIVQHLSFDQTALESYRLIYNRRSLDWLDSTFMLRLSLDRAVRKLIESGLEITSEPLRISLLDLHILRVNGCLPQLDNLLEACRDHLLLYQELREVRDMPPLIVS